ncbi:2-oxo-4-hydroxy-4-carboxy-5-ureidoimidazoline decarboxylase [Acinetobacter sp. ANC 4633]|uniref:2-oxo-4-hydroxy-4-carboxy-5-ureidoimidazoline decarboxylase n=1 Tax=Acinetobacter sp. ANC 4633 TaxID=2529845 RepID=UPI00103FE491|nr:2-oxo-4-hydroxy-4-carboxy-5-ureidoimidazoline decarboxylase [Acinetobacter sp. ANC 4633]TCB27084.1 2-oxo-4-hydroxy-4-carboxy-5-ureidoimidazoline decarboxylase [Acinetobacter sp. ANC 4633]
MQLSEFNQLSETQAQEFLKHCVHISSWVRTLSEQRPYPSKHTLINTAEMQTETWTWSDIQAALDAHPRIGEQQAKQALSAQEQAFSQKEQALIYQDVSTTDALYEANLTYEQKFGFIFLIKAVGLTHMDIFEALQQRLQNDLDTEKQVVHEQLAGIALHRLELGIESD